jgi:four helix bundle protein
VKSEGGEIRRGVSFPRVTLDHKDLVAYQRAASLADDLHAAIPGWPSVHLWTIGKQLLRAVDSIGANIAEGSGRWQPNDKRHFFVIARASLREAEHWVARAQALDLLDEQVPDRLRAIAGPLSGLIRAQRAR